MDLTRKPAERGLEAEGRNRWVLYSDKDNMSGEDPTTVPPEWHGAPMHLSRAFHTNAVP